MKRPALFTELYKLFKTKCYLIDPPVNSIMVGKIKGVAVDPGNSGIVFIFQRTGDESAFPVNANNVYANRNSAKLALKKQRGD